jgi:hypothetical protein
VKILCNCGFVVSTVSCPNPIGFFYLREKDADDIEIAAKGDTKASEIFDSIGSQALQGYRCPSCDRLLLFEERRDGLVAFYSREPDNE